MVAIKYEIPPPNDLRFWNPPFTKLKKTRHYKPKKSTPPSYAFRLRRVGFYAGYLMRAVRNLVTKSLVDLEDWCFWRALLVGVGSYEILLGWTHIAIECGMCTMSTGTIGMPLCSSTNVFPWYAILRPNNIHNATHQYMARAMDLRR